MIRITIEIDSLEEMPDMDDEAQVTQLQEDFQEVIRRLLTERNGIIEDVDGAPCILFKVETGLE